MYILVYIISDKDASQMKTQILRICHASLIVNPTQQHAIIDAAATTAIRNCSSCTNKYASECMNITSDRVRVWFDRVQDGLSPPLPTKKQFYTAWMPASNLIIQNVHGFKLTNDAVCSIFNDSANELVYDVYVLLFADASSAAKAMEQNVSGMAEWPTDTLYLQPCQLAKSFCIKQNFKSATSKSCEVCVSIHNAAYM